VILIGASSSNNDGSALNICYDSLTNHEIAFSGRGIIVPTLRFDAPFN
jgi:hypothetical protein